MNITNIDPVYVLLIGETIVIGFIIFMALYTTRKTSKRS